MVVAVNYNQRAKRVMYSDIHSVTLFNIVMTKNTDENGRYIFEGYHTTGGCGVAQDSGVLILLKDDILWNKMCFRFECLGTASCWSFMDSASNYGGSTGTPTGNMLAYSEASGDRLHDNFLTWEVPAYQSHNRTHACDNEANNFFRFDGGVFRKFRMTRRRNVGAGLAGIHHGRSCNTAGAGSAVTRITDIFIW
jgi:hypothetical protein